MTLVQGAQDLPTQGTPAVEQPGVTACAVHKRARRIIPPVREYVSWVTRYFSQGDWLLVDAAVIIMSGWLPNPDVSVAVMGIAINLSGAGD